MKLALALIALMGPLSAMASGSFECITQDGQTKIVGGDSSAGTWVTGAMINGRELVKGADFTADALYAGDRSFNFRIMDGNYNAILLNVETLRLGDLTAGLAWSPNESDATVQSITCEFSY